MTTHDRTNHRGKDWIQAMPDEDRERIGTLLKGIGGRDVVWGAQQSLEVWMAEHRMRAERLASERLTRATWVLAAVTIVLAAATVALVFATLQLT